MSIQRMVRSVFFNHYHQFLVFFILFGYETKCHKPYSIQLIKLN